MNDLKKSEITECSSYCSAQEREREVLTERRTELVCAQRKVQTNQAKRVMATVVANGSTATREQMGRERLLVT